MIHSGTTYTYASCGCGWESDRYNDGATPEPYLTAMAADTKHRNEHRRDDERDHHPDHNEGAATMHDDGERECPYCGDPIETHSFKLRWRGDWHHPDCARDRADEEGETWAPRHPLSRAVGA